MALSISQIVAVSYPAVLAEMRKAANQWDESALMRELERTGAVDRINFGSQIEVPLDYRRNPAGDFLATDMTPTSLAKTEVLTSAVYDIAELSIPFTWSKKDEVQNPSENQKIALVKSLLENAINSHDDMIEEAIFTTSTDGFLGLATHVTTAGTGSDGGIDSSVETFWRNKTNTYVDDTDIEAAMTTTYNQASKGSGAKLIPTLIVSDGATQALFEGTQQALQRWSDGKELNAGFKVLNFKGARYVFSQYGGTSQYFLNSRNFKLLVSKQYFRDRDETAKIPGVQAWTSSIYSALQSVTSNRSRLGIVHL